MPSSARHLRGCSSRRKSHDDHEEPLACVRALRVFVMSRRHDHRYCFKNGDLPLQRDEKCSSMFALFGARSQDQHSPRSPAPKKTGFRVFVAMLSSLRHLWRLFLTKKKSRCHEEPLACVRLLRAFVMAGDMTTPVLPQELYRPIPPSHLHERHRVRGEQLRRCYL
jgi:hypothetical protein